MFITVTSVFSHKIIFAMLKRAYSTALKKEVTEFKQDGNTAGAAAKHFGKCRHDPSKKKNPIRLALFKHKHGKILVLLKLILKTWMSSTVKK
jgi:hypothetical protein